MIYLLIGLAIWILAHGFKRAMPGLRAELGDRGRGLVAVLLLGSVALMVLGYRLWDADQAYDPPSWGRHANNLLMLIAVFLFGAGSSKGRARALMRHPMLTGLATWAVAHLLANGDWASVVLFGVLGLWSIGTMFVINAAEGPWDRPEPGPASKDLTLVIITLVIYGIIAGIHTWLGYYPFPG